MELCKGVYLAGPMGGMSAEKMKQWRIEATAQIEAAGINVLDPTRRIPFHSQIKNHDDRGLNINLAQRIFKQDLRDIARCEVIFVDARDHEGAKAQGTAAETMFAHMKNKIIVVWTGGALINPFFTAMATEIHQDFQDAVDACIDYGL